MDHVDGTGRDLHGSGVEALARANRAVAHDLRNVFTVINACAVDLYEEMHGRRAGALVLEILNAAERGLMATTDLLHAAPGGDDRPIDLCRHADELGPILRRLVGPEVELVTLSRDRRVFARIDRTSLMQILMNLVVNASDAMVEAGRVEVSVGRSVQVSPGGEPQHFATLVVADDGPGIVPEVLPRIFDDGFSTKTGQHFGVGLAVVRRVVERCGGSIEVHSTVGEGTTFLVRLPLESGRWSGRALVVVGDDVARGHLAAALEQDGFVVCVAADALEACDLAPGAELPDVAVLDDDAAADAGLWEMARLADVTEVLAVGEGTPVPMPTCATDAAALVLELSR